MVFAPEERERGRGLCKSCKNASRGMKKSTIAILGGHRGGTREGEWRYISVTFGEHMAGKRRRRRKGGGSLAAPELKQERKPEGVTYKAGAI